MNEELINKQINQYYIQRVPCFWSNTRRHEDCALVPLLHNPEYRLRGEVGVSGQRLAVPACMIK